MEYAVSVVAYGWVRMEADSADEAEKRVYANGCYFNLGDLLHGEVVDVVNDVDGCETIPMADWQSRVSEEKTINVDTIQRFAETMRKCAQYAAEEAVDKWGSATCALEEWDDVEGCVFDYVTRELDPSDTIKDAHDITDAAKRIVQRMLQKMANDEKEGN